MSRADREALQEQMRFRYATHYMELGERGDVEYDVQSDEPETDANEPTPYW